MDRVTQLLKVRSRWLIQLKLNDLSSAPKLPALKNVTLTLSDSDTTLPCPVGIASTDHLVHSFFHSLL